MNGKLPYELGLEMKQVSECIVFMTVRKYF